MYFFLDHIKNEYKFAQHIFIVLTKSQTKTLSLLTDLMNSWIVSNMGKMQMKPMTTSISHKDSI
jgi:hypothetical protein